MQLDRSAEEERLLSILTHQQPGPIILTGSEGCGKSSILKNAIMKENSIQEVLYLNLREQQVANGEELLLRLTKQSGYYFPSDALVSLGILKSALSPLDAEKSRKYIQEAFERCSKASSSSPPILVVDELHELNSSILANDEDVQRFLSWCIHLSDAKIGNCVFVCRDLTKFADESLWQQRRFSHEIKNPSLKDIEPSLLEVIPSKRDVDMVLDTLGSNLKDIELVCTKHMHSGKSVESIIDDLVKESCMQVEHVLNGVLENAASKRGSKDTKEGYKQVLRLWKMLEILSEKSCEKAELSKNFSRFHYELDDYIKKSSLFLAKWIDPSGLHIDAHSQRMRHAFKRITADPRMAQIKAESEKEIFKKELSQRESELTKRMRMHTEMMEACARMNSSEEDTFASSSSYLKWLETESEKCLEELSRIRKTYDANKWGSKFKYR